jgi:putative salt-induced outer membrane protein YdiY
MMKKNFLMFCAASAIVVFSAACAKKPSASFKLSKTTAAVGESITATFDGEETNAYLWSAWDGSVSTQTGTSSGNVTSISGGSRCDDSWTFSFTAPGTYTIWLNAKYYKEGCDCSDCSDRNPDETTKVITVQ